MSVAPTMRFIPTAMLRAVLLVAVIVLAAVSVPPQPAMAQRPVQLVVVFDGSGSMWGRLAGSSRSKLAAMREELGATLRDELPDVAIGLTTFGARSGNSCASAQAPLLPLPGQLDAFERALKRFNPQGRGPVVLGLRTAVQSVSAIPGPVRVLLIHDSLDNCNQNVCTFARELAAEQPRVSVDVISLGLKPTLRRVMSCLTRATRGRLINAETMDEAIAGVGDVIAALRDAAPITAPAPKAASAQPATPAAKGEAKPAPQTPGLTLLARLTGSDEAITDGITWRVASQSQLNQPIDRTIREAVAEIALPPARYKVTLETARVQISKEIEVGEGAPQQAVFEFDGGLVAVKTAPVKAPVIGVRQMRDDALVTVVHRPAEGGGRASAIWSGPARAARALLLERGRYRITVGNGLSRVVRTVEVVPGKRLEIPFGTGAARLAVQATDLTAAEAGDAEIIVAREVAGQPPKREVVARSAAAAATFELPAGPYHVTLRTPTASRSALVILAAGETLRHTLRLTQMALSVTSHVGVGDKLRAGDIRYRLWRANDLARPIAVSSKAEPVFRLPPGRYRIESRIDRQNAVLTREFDVGPGTTGSLKLRHRVGTVRFAPPSELGQQRQMPYWEVLDGEGRLVWRAFDLAPSAVLTAGSYRVNLAVKNQRFAADFSVETGQTQTVTVSRK